MRFYYKCIWICIFLISFLNISYSQHTFSQLSFSVAPLYGSAKFKKTKSIIGSCSSSIGNEIEGDFGFNTMLLVALINKNRFKVDAGIYYSKTNFKQSILNIRTSSDPVFDLSVEVHKSTIGIPIFVSYRLNKNDKKVTLKGVTGLIPCRVFSDMKNLAFTDEPNDQVFLNGSINIKDYNLKFYLGSQFNIKATENFLVGLTPFITTNLIYDELYLRVQEARDYSFGIAVSSTFIIK